MSKKQDAYYYNNFISCAEYSCKAVHLLKDILTHFNPDEISSKMDEIHNIEHQADATKHEMTDKLAKAFITPIEREDIIELSHNIDDVTDKVEEVLIRIYINNVQEIPEEALQLLDIVCKCCEEVWDMLKEFADFRHSKTLRDKIIAINTLEEDADALYISSMRKLHTEDYDIRHVIAWSEIYNYLEKCADACEHVADGVESVVMNNS